MGIYRLGDIIRMTRKSLSITQEQLCDGICSVETLSRVENGRQIPGKDVYELLMERLGRSRERAYSMLSISDYCIFEKMKLFSDYIERYDYFRAEKVLNLLKRSLGDSIMDKQFLMRGENIINYRLNRISAEEFLQGLEKSILLTIPQYGKISLSDWPLNYQETVLLLNISSALAQNNRYDKAIAILEEVSNFMRQSYVDEEQKIILQAKILSNLSKWYGLIKKHDKAIEIAMEGINFCKKYNLGNVLPNLLYSIVWNKEQLIRMGKLPLENKTECFKYLRQAYYIAGVMQQKLIQQFLLDHINKYYGSCKLLD
ncbi:helix-turn-helix domain-containing protein [Anaerocolumna chitinilytica]|uniref:HTH cro/C1-type domain-containing protein n=1 Tax=Anaerocolumna chitinilytica TaxID=1727145 RepID=A0A7I8DRW5_9FIRM|nr:helix-turn-helix domain-containing protein [Anaerocolumna chitinilytica]BCK00045.1 hypothetical protein bsdcttw_30850 [Anaerocolumna chitinilytica]